MPVEKKDTPDFENAAYASMCGGWTLWGDVLGGQDTIKAKGEKYLPKEPAEDDQDYKRRLARSIFFEDPRDCTINLSGIVFRKSPTLGEDVPEVLRELAENIDNAGTHLDVLLQRLFEDGFYGHSFIVVERPPQDPNVVTAADEIAAGDRSYWCLRQAKDAVNFRPLIMRGKTQIGQISFRECTKEPDGRFGEKEVVRYRVYLLDESGNAQWEVWREISNAKSEKETILEDSGPILTKRRRPMKRLPIAVHYGEREGFLESRPPLKGIADISVSIYQKYSDLSNIEHFTCVPTLVITGGDDQKNDFVMGGNRAIFLPLNATAEFLQVDGKSIEHLEKDLDNLNKRLVAKGLDFVNDDKYVPPTATEVILSYTERTSKLAKMVRSLIDCTEEALDITAEMEGLDEGGSITIGVDENSLTLSAEQMRILSEWNERGQLSLHTLWQIMDRADQLPDDFNEEEELARLKQAALEQMELNAKQFDAGLESTP
jgi:Domain of unknown function (DUF4055)